MSIMEGTFEKDANKIRCIDLMWSNPSPAFDIQFNTMKRNRYTPTRGQGGEKNIDLTLYNGHIYVQCNHGHPNAGAKGIDVFTYLQSAYNARNFYETMQEIARRYGVTLEMTQTEKQAKQRADLITELCKFTVKELQEHPEGEAAAYLKNVRGFSNDGIHFGELTTSGANRFAAYIRKANTGLSDIEITDTLKKLHFTEERAMQGYNLVMPYFHNGRCTGFMYRCLRQPPERMGKLIYPYKDIFTLNGYCDRLDYGKPVCVTEGPFDALRLMAAGCMNVVAMGGANPTEETLKFLHSLNRDGLDIMYVPDTELDLTMKRTDLMGATTAKFLTAEVDGCRVVKHLYIASIPAEVIRQEPGRWKKYGSDGTHKGYKIDADDYGKAFGADAMGRIITGNVIWWKFEIDALVEWASTQGDADVSQDFADRFDAIYKKVGPYERKLVQNYIRKNEICARNGVTPEALQDIDGWNNDRENRNRIKAAADDLQKVVNDGANPVKVAEVLQRFAELQAADTREEWARQLGQSFDEELEEIRNQPDTLKTKWKLGKVSGKGMFNKYNDIEFYPADVVVFCAATSHGKTAILFQSALDLVETDRENGEQKIYLYVSCEENKRQLLERALNVYIDIPTTETGRDANGKYCFISQTRKKSIKAAIRGGYAPSEYKPVMGHSEHFSELQKRITAKIGQYGREVRPFLKLIHTDGTTESIVTNITHYVNKLQDEGQTVGAVFIDYAQLLTSDTKNFSRQDELKDIIKALEKCAKKTELPFIMAAQLNRESIKNGIDSITLANLGEAADIERAAHDVYLIWQVDKTKKDMYLKTETKTKGKGENATKYEAYKLNAGERSYRIFTQPEPNVLHPEQTEAPELKDGYLYVETMKARDGRTGGWGMLPFDGERGRVDVNDIIGGMGSIGQVMGKDKE